MPDAPKIVHDRLRAAAPREAHPEADVLTAFTEQALSGTEREGVMRHLSRCGECREVVALSIPPSLEVATRPHEESAIIAPRRSETPRSWLAWPTLRWAAMAASVVVVASVLILHPGKQSEITVAVVPARHNEATSVASGDKSVPLATPRPGQLGAMKSDSSNNTLRDEKRAAAGTRGISIAGNNSPARPIQKSKDAAESYSNIARTKKQSDKNAPPQWSLAQGRLQRSPDAGTTWQTVLQLQQSLLCFGALGSEVWAGGQGGALAHSNDGGTAWTMVHPAMKAEMLSGDIVVIEVVNATEIALSTSTQESWTTTDGGLTWIKKTFAAK